MRRPRDSQRGRLYKAEGACFGYDWPKMKTLDEVTDYVAWITGTKWWAKRYPSIAPGSVRVTDGRGRRNAEARGIDHILLPRAMRTQWIVLHELAHLGTNSIYRSRTYAGHGPEFAVEYLALVQRFLGRDWSGQLRDYFRDHGVRYYPARRATYRK
jgi:putative metallohydrolase (TIGR04338 family)